MTFPEKNDSRRRASFPSCLEKVLLFALFMTVLSVCVLVFLAGLVVAGGL